MHRVMLIHFRHRCDVDSLPSPVVPTAKERRKEFVRNVLDQTTISHSVRVQEVELISGQFKGIITEGTAVKYGADFWKLVMQNRSGKPDEIEMSAKDLVDSEKYYVMAESLSLETTDKQKRQQREAEKRLLQEEARRRENIATEKAKEARTKMLQEEYEKLAGRLASGRSYSFSDFMDLERKLTTSFEFSVEVEGETIIGFANHDQAGAFNQAVHNAIFDRLFCGKRQQLSEEGNTSKRRKTTPSVPTIASEDGLTAYEHVENHDRMTTQENNVKTMKSLVREQSSLKKQGKELDKYKEKHGLSYFNVQASSVKAHVASIYRLYGGTGSRTIEEMKAYLLQKRVNAATAEDKIALIDEKASRITARLDELASITPAVNSNDENNDDGTPAADDEMSITYLGPSTPCQTLATHASVASVASESTTR